MDVHFLGLLTATKPLAALYSPLAGNPRSRSSHLPPCSLQMKVSPKPQQVNISGQLSVVLLQSPSPLPALHAKPMCCREWPGREVVQEPAEDHRPQAQQEVD